MSASSTDTDSCTSYLNTIIVGVGASVGAVIVIILIVVIAVVIIIWRKQRDTPSVSQNGAHTSSSIHPSAHHATGHVGIAGPPTPMAVAEVCPQQEIPTVMAVAPVALEKEAFNSLPVAVAVATNVVP